MSTADVTPLEMAQNCAREILRLAEYQQTDPVMSHVHRTGEQGRLLGHMAGDMALVSIAESLHRVAAAAEALVSEAQLR